MAASYIPQDGREQRECDGFNEFLSSLPREDKAQVYPLYQYQGFWYFSGTLSAIFTIQQHFKARDTDVILATVPKSGTTWLKALAFALINRSRFPSSQTHPLLTNNPHKLVPFLESQLYANGRIPDLHNALSPPAIFATHLPYSMLPESMKVSSSKIVCLCRNPKDVVVSRWHFAAQLVAKNRTTTIPLEEAFEMFCAGISGCGPFWDHVLEYWKASLERPHKILFLRYEELTREPVLLLKKVADFLGYPFTVKECEEGVVEDIARLCSFENLRNLEVNRTGKVQQEVIDLAGVEHRLFFRQGEVGGWSKYLTPQMVERLDRITEEKFRGSGLTFELGV